MGNESIHRTVQRRYSQGHHQNQATYMGLEKEFHRRDPWSKHNWWKSKQSKQYVSIANANRVRGLGEALSPTIPIGGL